MKTERARREFLRRLGLGLGSVALGPSIANRLTQAILETAMAQTAPAPNPVGYYLYLTFPGGPPRWYFDLPLTPNDSMMAGFKAGYFGTSLINDAKGSRVEYKTKKFNLGGGKSVNLPPVWSMDLARHRFSDLLSNTLMIRGINNRIDSHEISALQQVAPIFGGLSLNGSVADASNRPLPALLDPTAPPSKAFKSNRGLVGNNADYALNATRNPASSLLMPFKNWLGGRYMHTPAAGALQNQALAQFDQYAQVSGITSSALSEMYDNAIQLVGKDIFKLGDQWGETYARYQKIVTEALSPSPGSLPGLFDKPIFSKNASDPAFAIDFDEEVYVTHPDMRGMITDALIAPNMAANFALAEIMIDKLTCSMCLGFRGMQNLVINPRGDKYDVTHDQHHIGTVISTVTTTLFYRAFLGCLSENVSSLKAKNLFDKTVIHIASEFSRTPDRPGGTGHGARASNTTLISGKFRDFNLIGNIVSATPLGTYGVAAPFAVGLAGNPFSREIQCNDVARTVTQMLGTRDVTTNGMLLTKFEGGAWVPTYREAKNV